MTLQISIASYPEGREDLGVFTNPIEITYTRQTGTIDDAWFVERRRAPGSDCYCDHLTPIPVALAWRLLGGKSELVREYLDHLVEQVLLDGAA